MKNILFGSLLFLSVLASGQGLEDIIVEKYYISDANDAAGSGGSLPAGSATYRVYIDMAEGYKLRAIFTSPDYAQTLRIETTTNFFNYKNTGTANEIKDMDLADNLTMLDSWISLGAASSGNLGVIKSGDTNDAQYNQGATGYLQNADPQAGTPIKLKDGMVPGTPASISVQDLDLSVFQSSTDSLFYQENGSWYNIDGAVGPTAENKVLIAQLTTSGTLSFSINFVLINPNGFTEQYVHNNAGDVKDILCEKCTFKGVSTSIEDLRLESKKAEFRVFPNPAQNVLNIELAEGEDANYSYSIYDIVGNKKLENMNNQGSQRYIGDIDISSLPKGAYMIRLVSDGGLNSAKMFIKK